MAKVHSQRHTVDMFLINNILIFKSKLKLLIFENFNCTGVKLYIRILLGTKVTAELSGNKIYPFLEMSSGLKGKEIVIIL